MPSAPLAFAGPFLCLILSPACAEPRPSARAPASQLHPLEGRWEGDGDAGPCSLTVVGDILYFYARPDFQYEASFTLAAGAGLPELHATILDTPRTTDSAGEEVLAIYELENGTLRLAVVEKSPGSFDDAIARYRFERVGD